MSLHVAIGLGREREVISPTAPPDFVCVTCESQCGQTSAVSGKIHCHNILHVVTSCLRVSVARWSRRTTHTLVLDCTEHELQLHTRTNFPIALGKALTVVVIGLLTALGSSIIETYPRQRWADSAIDKCGNVGVGECQLRGSALRPKRKRWQQRQLRD